MEGTMSSQAHVYVFPAATHSPWLQAWPLHGVGAGGAGGGGGAVTTTGGAGAGAGSSPPLKATATHVKRCLQMGAPWFQVHLLADSAKFVNLELRWLSFEPVNFEAVS